jgi:hypothetical protein
MFGNYLPTANPYGLAEPPAWFLKDLYEFDPDLVIFPSMEDAAYCLARRVKHGAPLAVSLLKDKHPNATFCMTHRLLSITGILPGAHWGPLLLGDLQRMDMWRSGGADKHCDALERLEEEKRQKQDLLTVDEAEQRSVSAYAALKLREGSTTFVSGYSAPK